MKKVLLFLVLGFALVACSKECEPGAVELGTVSGKPAMRVCNDSGHWVTETLYKSTEPSQSEEVGE